MIVLRAQVLAPANAIGIEDEGTGVHMTVIGGGSPAFYGQKECMRIRPRTAENGERDDAVAVRQFSGAEGRRVILSKSPAQIARKGRKRSAVISGGGDMVPDK